MLLCYKFKNLLLLLELEPCYLPVSRINLCYDDNVALNEKEAEMGGDASAAAAADQSCDAVNDDAVRDTYIDTLNLWV